MFHCMHWSGNLETIISCIINLETIISCVGQLIWKPWLHASCSSETMTECANCGRETELKPSLSSLFSRSDSQFTFFLFSSLLVFPSIYFYVPINFLSSLLKLSFLRTINSMKVPRMIESIIFRKEEISQLTN